MYNVYLVSVLTCQSMPVPTMMALIALACVVCVRMQGPEGHLTTKKVCRLAMVAAAI